MDKVRQNHAEYRSCDMIEIEIAVIGVLRRDVEGRETAGIGALRNPTPTMGRPRFALARAS